MYLSMDQKLCKDNKKNWDETQKYCYDNIESDDCKDFTDENSAEKFIFKPIFISGKCKNNKQKTNCGKNNSINEAIKKYEEQKNIHLPRSKGAGFGRSCKMGNKTTQKRCENDKNNYKTREKAKYNTANKNLNVQKNY